MADMTIQSTREDAAAQPAQLATVRDYWELLKPRVMSLVVFTALVGLLTAPGDIHPVLGFTAILCIAVGAGASGALNMWYDADIDCQMARTRRRPVPSGQVQAREALGFGVTLSVGAVTVMGLAVGWVPAGLLALTILYYVVFYTMWLKRRTPQNIVIGGAAGAFPPMIGWAAVTGDISLQPVLMFAIIFLWTPPHFWALALFRRGDYEAAGVPMLPVVAGEKETRRQILLYCVALTLAAVAPYPFGASGVVYGSVALIMSAALLYWGWRVWREGEGETKAAKKLFGVSILYLFVIFTALLVDRYVGAML